MERMEVPVSWTWHAAAARSERFVFFCVATLQFVSMGLAFVALARGTVAPYGRFSAHRSFGMDWGAPVPARLAWVLQESPNLIAVVVCWWWGDSHVVSSAANQVLMALFVIHYVNRTVLFPLRMRGGKPTPFRVMLSAMWYCAVNGYLQLRFLTHLHRFPDSTVSSPLFVGGCLLWAVGFGINYQADDILRNLRKPGETGYKIPRGGMFEFVSGANFLGEILEWTGYALAMGLHMPGVVFAVTTAANIGPRAVHHHKWYLDKFDNYPKHRRALIPFVL